MAADCVRNSGIAGARRIVATGGRRELGCTSIRWAERHPQGVCRIRKAAEPPTAAQQRMIGAEASRIAASNAATPRYGQCNRQALQFFELLACNVDPFSWGSKGDILFPWKENIPLNRVPARCRDQCAAPTALPPPRHKCREALRTGAKPIVPFIYNR